MLNEHRGVNFKLEDYANFSHCDLQLKRHIWKGIAKITEANW